MCLNYIYLNFNRHLGGVPIVQPVALKIVFLDTFLRLSKDITQTNEQHVSTERLKE